MKNVKYRKKRNRIKALYITMVCTGLLAYVVYTTLNKDGFDSSEVYAISDVAMGIESPDNFTGRLVTPQPRLIISGDDKKVQKLKEQAGVPEITLNVKEKNKEGVYQVTPEVKDKLIGVDYTFQPSEMDVKLLANQLKQFEVIERPYGLAKSGYVVGKSVALTKAGIKVTEEDEAVMGQVVVEFDSSTIAKSGELLGEVVVLDRKGEVLEGMNIATEKIPVNVTLDKMSWLQTKEDIANMKADKKKLAGELVTKRAKLQRTKDVLQRKDLMKEINFREVRIKKHTKDIAYKESILGTLKAQQEAKKKAEERKSLKDGGVLEDELKKE